MSTYICMRWFSMASMPRAKRQRESAKPQSMRAALDDDDKPQFQVLPSPETEEIVRLAESLAERIPKFLQSRGLGPDSPLEESDPLSCDQPWLAGVYAASVLGRAAFGPNAGHRVT